LARRALKGAGKDVIVETSDCPFCLKLAAPESHAREDLIWDFPHSVAFLGTWQYYHGYCLLISRRHATELNQLSAAERGGYLEEMCLLARAIEACVKPRKMNYELLGNQVPHLHWHLFPRSADDPDTLKPVWITLDRADRDEIERQRLQTGPIDRATTIAMLRHKLQALTGAG
jgi:diadenosine tetraphosphate (Ap4A) HIT family hydrolase